jgi:hypothetical protein
MQAGEARENEAPSPRTAAWCALPASMSLLGDLGLWMLMPAAGRAGVLLLVVAATSAAAIGTGEQAVLVHPCMMSRIFLPPMVLHAACNPQAAVRLSTGAGRRRRGGLSPGWRSGAHRGHGPLYSEAILCCCLQAARDRPWDSHACECHSTGSRAV